MMGKPRIILLNGASSSGKSTLSGVLRSSAEEATGDGWGVLSIDDFLSMSVDEKIYEDDVYEASRMLCGAAVGMARSGRNVILEHVITSGRIFRELTETLGFCDIYLIHVTCPLHELRRREQVRRNRFAGSAESSLKYLFPPAAYDLTVDTFRTSAGECARQIVDALQNQPEAIHRVPYGLSE